jgi:UPF0271 protein
MDAMQIDLNCDLGELGDGYPHDAELMGLITSANVACGGHTGDLHSMRETLRLAKQHCVQVGAHPSHPDREHFGRRDMDRSPQQISVDCLAQIRALVEAATAEGIVIRYVKPHGALYNQAGREPLVAGAVVRAARETNLAIMGLPGSALAKAAEQAGVRFIREGFADRRYLADGSLVPRSQPNALIEDVEEAVMQAEQLVRERGIESICVHGDNPRAVEFVQTLRKKLLHNGWEIRAPKLD